MSDCLWTQSMMQSQFKILKDGLEDQIGAPTAKPTSALEYLIDLADDDDDNDDDDDDDSYDDEEEEEDQRHRLRSPPQLKNI